MFDYADKLKLRRYSDSAFRIYGWYFKLFLSAHIHKLPEEITDEEIKAFLLDIFTTNDYASKTQNQIITAIKFYYEQVLGLNKKQYWIDRPFRYLPWVWCYWVYFNSSHWCICHFFLHQFDI
jgi:integrase/recombinase XerD